MLESFLLSKDALVSAFREGTSIGIRRCTTGDTAGQANALPFPGAASVHDDPGHAYSTISYSPSGCTPLPRTFEFDGATSMDPGLWLSV